MLLGEAAVLSVSPAQGVPRFGCSSVVISKAHNPDRVCVKERRSRDGPVKAVQRG